MLKKIESSLKIIDLKITKAKCKCFIAKNKQDLTICGCGRPKDKHDVEALNNYEKKTKWEDVDCTAEDGYTDAYGEMIFCDRNQSAKYIRLNHLTDVTKIITDNSMLSIWNLKLPNLLISVTGGAQFKINSDLKDVFCSGIVRAANSTNGWISTGGTYTGIMRYVGETANKKEFQTDKKMVVLGITNWTTVANKEELILNEDYNGPVEYELSKETVDQNDKNKKKEELLDPNHTHFFLVDNARLNEYGGEIEFRAKLEAEIQKYVPVIMVVVEGGPNTARTVLKSIKNGIPCIFVDKSGRFSDILSFVYEIVQKEEIEKERSQKQMIEIEDLKENKSKESKFNNALKHDVKKMIIKAFPNKGNDLYDELTNSVEEIFDPKYSHLISSFKLNAEKNANDIDETILKGLIKAKKERFESTIKLCLTWNRIDIAKNHIFTPYFREKIVKSNCLPNMMILAIEQNRPEFVELFIENGFNIKQFLTYDILFNFYKKIPKPSDIFYKMLHKTTSENSQHVTFNLIGKVIENLNNDTYRHKFTTDRFKKNESLIINEDLCEQPEHELFMLNILLCRYEMALIFWREGKNQISSALAAALIIKNLANTLDLDSNKYVELTNMSKDFENLACQLLNICYESDEIKAEQMLQTKIDEFSETTPIQLAIAGTSLEFIGHRCFQGLVVKKWYNKISAITPQYRLFLSILMPLFVLFVYFTDDNNQEFEQEIEKIEENYKSKIEKLSLKERIKTRLIIFYIEQKYFIKTFIKHIFSFMNTPLIKFMYNQILLVFFLLLFSYVMLCDFYPTYVQRDQTTSLGLGISIPEIVLIFWVISYGIEEARQLIQSENRSVWKKIKFYVTDLLNMIEMGALVLFLIGMILRFIPDRQCYIAGRLFLCIDLILWFLRSLYSYTFIRSLGPKILMIIGMTKEMAYFMLIVLLAMFTFGISTQALLYHNQDLNSKLLKNVFFPAYFVFGGEYLDRETIMGANYDCQSNNSLIYDKYDDPDCPDYVGSQITITMYVFYVLFLFILLQNLLIALFSNIYTSIENKSDKIWKYQRYFLVFEFYQKPLILPPFNFFYYIYAMIVEFISTISDKNHKQINDSYAFIYEYNFESDEKTLLENWETFLANELLIQLDRDLKNSSSYKVKQNEEKLDALYRAFEGLNEINNETNKVMKNVEDKFKKIFSKIKQEKEVPLTPTDISFDKISPLENLIKNKVKEAESKPTKSEKGIDTNFLKVLDLEEEADVSKSDVYPETNIKKFKVDPRFKNWFEKYKNYEPIKYTSQIILMKPEADLDLISYTNIYRPKIQFNEYDEKFKIDRTSCMKYDVVNGIPLNPLGRTGIKGRGNLYFFGPNYCILAIFKRTLPNGPKQIAFYTNDDDSYSLPELFTRNLSYNNKIIAEKLASKVFDNEALKDESNMKKIVEIIQSSQLINQCVINNDLNTDNAWIEYFVIAYEDEIFNNIPLKKHETEKNLIWVDLDESLIKKIKPKKNAKYLI